MKVELQLQVPTGVDFVEADRMLAIKLYEAGELSLGQAAKLVGYSKRAFIAFLGKNGVPVINYPAEELEREMELSLGEK